MWNYYEKVDGTNIRVQYGGSVYFKGKTDKADISSFLLEKLIKLFPEEKLGKIFTDVPTRESAVCLYGEGYGARIQKGGGNYISNDVSFILFDVKIDDWWLKREDVEEVASKLGIKVVPLIGFGILESGIEIVRNGFRSRIAEKDIMAEGLVMKPKIEMRNRRGHRIITKIKYKDFIRKEV